MLALWSNAGRRELGLEGFDDRRGRQDRFAFIRPEAEDDASRDEPARAVRHP